jgi:metal-responsive CopG/Arc/MetJ family transcriptional regulator
MVSQKYLPREYDYLVRVKTSVTFPSDLLARLDHVDKNRSALLERAAIAYLAQLERLDRDRKDVEIINRNAGRLNREAQDTLEYQQLPLRGRPARRS